MSFKSGDVLWVKCGQLFWPCQVLGEKDMDADLKESVAADKKKPMAVVKFFNEDGYEFLYNSKNVFPYNCDRKEEFIKKGIVKSRTKSKEGATDGWFAKFPKDIVLCEELTNGDPNILEKEPFVEKNDRPNYKDLFGTPEEKTKKEKGKRGGAKRKSTGDAKREPPNKRPIIHPRFQGKAADHQVKMLPQPSTPYHLDLIKSQDEKDEKASPSTSGSGFSASGGSGGAFSCHKCGLSASRLNVIVLHQKTCQGNTPSPSPGRGRKRGGSAAKRSPAARKPATPKSSTPASTGSRRRATPSQPKSSPAKESPKASPAKANSSAVQSPTKETPKRRGRAKKSKEDEAVEEKRKEAQRKKILGDWSEEEEGENQEKQKLRDVLEEPFVDSSEEEEENDNWMMEDNIQGNFYEGEDDEPLGVAKEKADQEKEKEKEKQNGNKSDADLLSLDVDKVLEETVPSADALTQAVEKKTPKSRKSVKFADQPKEIVEGKIALVQPESNLDVPPIVDDEFDEFVNDIPIPIAPPKVYSPARKVIRKPEESEEKMHLDPTPVTEATNPVNIDAAPPVKSSAQVAAAAEEISQPSKKLSLADEWDDDETEEPAPAKTQVTSSTPAPSASTEAVSSTSAASIPADSTTSTQEPTEDQAAPLVQTTVDTQVSYSMQGPIVSAVSQTAPESNVPASDKPAEPAQVMVTGASSDVAVAVSTATAVSGVTTGADGETYLILVDDGSGAVDSLNSQTLYIDPSQLANGDLSTNMVLMTNEGVAVPAQPVSAPPTASIVTEAQAVTTTTATTAPDQGQ